MMNCPGNSMAHLAAALPKHIMMEVIDAGFETLLDVDSHIEDGYIVLGDAPGLGVEYDEEKLEQMAVAPTGARSSAVPTARRRGAGLYSVRVEEPLEMDAGVAGARESASALMILRRSSLHVQNRDRAIGRIWRHLASGGPSLSAVRVQFRHPRTPQRLVHPVASCWIPSRVVDAALRHPDH